MNKNLGVVDRSCIFSNLLERKGTKRFGEGYGYGGAYKTRQIFLHSPPQEDYDGLVSCRIGDT